MDRVAEEGDVVVDPPVNSLSRASANNKGTLDVRVVYDPPQGGVPAVDSRTRVLVQDGFVRRTE